MSTTAISAARFKLAYERPYIATAVWNLIPTETKGLGTLAVDKFWRLYYDPEVANKWTVDQLVAVLYHEINHLLRDHAGRSEGKANHKVWNQAGDAEINDDIRAEGCWDLPGNPVFPEQFGEDEGKIAEVYYEKLMKDPKNQQQGDGEPGAGNCGSAAGGEPGEHEQGEPTDNNSPGVAEGEGQALKDQVAREVAEAAKGRGDIPAHLKRWAEELTKEKVDWRRTLASAIRNTISHTSGANDFTFTKMSRRNQGDIILPATISPIPNGAVVIDTSGSMSKDMVNAAIVETAAIIKRLGATQGVNVISCDAAVATAKKCFKADQIAPEGGGGTDMRVGIDHAMKMKPKPDYVVVITDGDTPWPKEAPNTKLIVCLVPGYYKRQTPDYAKTVIVEES